MCAGLGLWGGKDDEEGSAVGMGLFDEIRNRARHVIGSVLGVSVVTYFAYHVIHGDRGLLAWWQLQQRIDAVKRTAERVSSERQVLEKRVRLLHPESLDRDMLEERARVMLNYGHKDDVIILEEKRSE